MYRKFTLKNEKGAEFNLTDIENKSFLYKPSGLGYSTDYTFYKFGDTFQVDDSSQRQTEITGELIFKDYPFYRSFVNFVEESESLKLFYSIPNNKNYETYHKTVVLQTIGKTEKNTKTGFLHCDVIFKGLDNWKKEEILFAGEVTTTEAEARYDFKWDAYLKEYKLNDFIYENVSHAEAGFKLDIKGGITNPRIKITHEDGEVITDIKMLGTLNANDKLSYSTVSDDLYIYIYRNNTKYNLYQTFPLSRNTLNFRKLRKGINRIDITADTDVKEIELRIYPEYKSV